MPFESLSDEKIAELLNCRKRLTNPNAKKKLKDGNEQVNYKVRAEDGSGYEFEVYMRQNLRAGMEDSYSCGISWLSPNGEALTLRRYNGPSHYHINQIEKQKLNYVTHIHTANEKYLKANKKPEGYAEATDRYKTIDGAFACLVKDCNISGVQTTPDNLTQLKLL